MQYFSLNTLIKWKRIHIQFLTYNDNVLQRKITEIRVYHIKAANMHLLVVKTNLNMNMQVYQEQLLIF